MYTALVVLHGVKDGGQLKFPYVSRQYPLSDMGTAYMWPNAVVQDKTCVCNLKSMYAITTVKEHEELWMLRVFVRSKMVG